MSSNSSKKRMNKFIVVVETDLFVHFLGEFEDTKKSFQNYLTFSLYAFQRPQPGTMSMPNPHWHIFLNTFLSAAFRQIIFVKCKIISIIDSDVTLWCLYVHGTP